MKRSLILFLSMRTLNLFLAGLAFATSLLLTCGSYEPVLTLVPLGLVGKKVVLDPGHGGVDPGAHDDRGFLEKDLVLDVARRVRLLLTAAGAEVLLTRNGDYDLAPPEMTSLWERKKYDLRKRVELANRTGADVYLSIHANCHSDPQRQGQRVYYASRGDSARLARSLDRALSRFTGTAYGVQEGSYFVLRHTAMPAVLVEVGFISNPGEKERLQNPAYRAGLAEAIFLGTLYYFEEQG